MDLSNLDSTTRIIGLCASGLFMVLLTGCISPNSLQSGRTIGKGKMDVTYSVTEGQYNDHFVDEKNRFDYIPIFEGSMKYGVCENFDISCKFSTASFASAQVKLQFLGNKKSLFAASVGADAGIIIISEEITYWHTSIPLYLSIHPTDKFAIYITPRYCHSNRLLSNTAQGYGYINDGYWNYIDLSYGLIFGKQNRFMIEITHSERNSFKPMQVSFGFAFDIDVSKVFSNNPQYPYYRGKRHKYK
jgi:hypothetical protein